MKKYLVPVLVILVIVLGAWAILKQSSPNGSDLLGAVSSGVSSPAITVTFPNSGELLFRGTSTPILWNSAERYDVKIELIAADTGKTYILATSTPTRKTGGRFVWKKIGFDLSGNVVPDNKYYVQICQVNTGTAKAACDKSDLPVVVYTYIANKPPRIKNITGPGELKVNEEGAWSITAVDPENGPLSYNVYWGDEVGVGKSYSQTATFKHVYTNPGTYYVYFMVKDTAGQVASGAVMVNVVKVGVGKPVVSVGKAGASLLVPPQPYPADQGPMFVASYEVKITASGGDVYIPVDYTFSNIILNGGNSVLTPPLGSSIGSTDPQIPCLNAKGNCWLIKSGQTIYLSPSFSYNTYQMFAGNYSAYLQSISQVVDGSYLDTPIPYTPTNSVVVVGERSPYLNSVTSPVATGTYGLIDGVRLASTTINSNTTYPLTKVGGSGDTKVGFLVDGRENPGSYILWLDNPTTGASNRLWFEVVKGVSTSTAVVVVSNTPDNSEPKQIIAASGINRDSKDGVFLMENYIKVEKESVRLQDVIFGIKKSGSVQVKEAFLYDGTTLVGTGVIGSSSISFLNLYYNLPRDVYPSKKLTLKANLTKASDYPSTLSAYLSPKEGGLKMSNENGDRVVNISGYAEGAPLTIFKRGPEVSLIVKSISKSSSPAQNGISTTTVSAYFNVQIKAVGGDIILGNVASTAPAFSVNGTGPLDELGSFLVLRNGIREMPIGLSRLSSFNITSGSYVINNSYELSEGNVYTIPVSFSFEGRTKDGVLLTPGNYSVGINNFRWVANGSAAGLVLSTFMSGSSAWQTSAVSLP